MYIISIFPIKYVHVYQFQMLIKKKYWMESASRIIYNKFMQKNIHVYVSVHAQMQSSN